MHEKIMTYATVCTCVRIIAAPFIVWAMVHAQWSFAFYCFIAAALTDIIDGFLARYFNQITFFGACLDPVADKILLLSSFFTLSFIPNPVCVIPHWFFYVVLCKELVQCIGAVLLFLTKVPVTVSATTLSKSSTCIHIFFIVSLFLHYFLTGQLFQEYTICYVTLTILLGATLIDYAYKALKLYGKAKGE